MRYGKYLARFGILWGIVALLLIGVSAQASRIDDLRAQLALRRAEREAARNIVRPAPDEENQPEENNQVPDGQQPCVCSVSLSLDAPDVSWNGNSLVFTPRFDVDIRVRGNNNAAPWNVTLDYQGQAQFSSSTLAAPTGASFSGQKEWSGQCFNTSSRFRSLSGNPVSLATLARSLFSDSMAKLNATVLLNASLGGCDVDAEKSQYSFAVGSFGNIDLGRWRRLR